MGARILEKHFTSDKNWDGPDIPISISPTELKELIDGSRAIFKALGGSKKILPEEQPTINFAYACVVTLKEISKGEVFNEENLWVKRPGTGISPMLWDEVIGRTAIRDFEVDELIEL